MGLQQHAYNYINRQGFYMLSDCSHPTEPHPIQWLFTPHCTVHMSSFPLYVLGNLTEKINIYDKGRMGRGGFQSSYCLFFFKVTVKWFLKKGFKEASNPKVWFCGSLAQNLKLLSLIAEEILLKNKYSLYSVHVSIKEYKSGLSLRFQVAG